ncbi:MAG: glycosyltransferase [Chthoniobacteraceae bacterium]|nr:glycosyltransferase [Chthoniobacteraceae bacterium]
MIKKVHYCWFGGKVPANVAANVEKWKRLNPDFEFCEWNEGNIDVSAYAFGRRALEQKRWGYLVDIIRPQKLYTEGGFYLDADIELIRPLRSLEKEGDYLIMGYMYSCALGTAALYSPPGHPVIGKILEQYRHIRPDCWPVSNSVFTDYFVNRVPGFLLNGRQWKSEELKISLHPKEFFEQPAFVREQGLSIHHFSGSWMPEQEGAAYRAEGGGSSHKVKWAKRKVRTYLALLHSEYRRAYARALFGLPTRVSKPWKESAE